MIIGIDVGGTYTDGVVYEKGRIEKTAKKTTRTDDIKSSILEVLDELIVSRKEKIQRLVISTTLVTNIIATGGGEKTALILLPGHGLPHELYDISENTFFLGGSIDFRGREIEKINENEVINCLKTVKSSGIKRIAVAGKFSNRNNKHEKIVKDLCLKYYPESSVVISSEVVNKLNFPRRAATTYFTAMTAKEWHTFAEEIKAALKARGIKAPVDVLKADGGTIPLEKSLQIPCETVFSGPAASTMGGAALTMDNKNSVVIDIGGTTSDISLLIEGNPLYASKGALINGNYTHVNAFAVHSVPLGGDSLVYFEEGKVKVAPYREGAAACLGGMKPTVTDAFNLKYNLNIGNPEFSHKALYELSISSGKDIDVICDEVVEMVIGTLSNAINNMFKEWENEPAYKVWEVINKRKFIPDRLIGIGAASKAIIPVLSEKMNLPYFLHTYSPTANALGAAVARPTLTVNLHIDTAQRIASVDPGGIVTVLEKAENFQLEDAKNLALHFMKKFGEERGMADYINDFVFYQEEQFNIIRGWDRVGKIFDIEVQISPGFIPEYKGVVS
ncbi:hydantoinase/oxoprolinase family protein [Thermosyntropha sp.]|uniref:hydantoinase/oxoprolinase family protein n=1 Tax=Thermosyntropha sp. TaxID=2740820 RepID=UPI0025E9E6C3|nr:hydantoinase/oxoprolinase family protein [Thermosyntropha sp.]MBO8158378.1 hydantoinase/oxoprolinase family protein [Thermosyntropha sp.]